MRSSTAKKTMLLACPAALALMLFGASMKSRATTTAPVSGTPTTSPAPAFAAMAYYDQNCAHCHGPQGSFYGPTLGQDLTDSQLQKAVNDMASGAGNAPLAADELPVETAFHRALIMRKPFLSVTQIGADGQWAGEAMPDAKVILTLGGKTIAATSDAWSWTAQLPAGAKASDVKITAKLGGAVTSIDPGRASYSNTDPIPPVADRPK